MTVTDQPFKIETTVEDVNNILKRAKPALLTRGGMLPILSGVLIEPMPGGRARFTVSDLDLTCRIVLHADVKLGNPKVVPYKSFKKVLDVAKKGGLTLTAEGDNVILSAGRTSVSLPSDPGEDFPKVHDEPVGEDVTVLNIAPKAIGSVLPAVSTDDNRPIITAVCVDGSEYVATDSYRLYTVDTGRTSGTDHPVLFPRKFAAEVAKSQRSEVAVRFDGKDLFFTEDDVTWGSRVVQGEFPNWRSLIPANREFVVTWGDDFLPALTDFRKMRSAIVGDAPFRFQPGENGHITLFAGSEGNPSVDASVTGWAKCQVAFNVDYLAELVAGFPITGLYGVDALKPSMGEVRNGDWVERRLLMPVRVS